MYKIAISGKANAGKDTVAKFFPEVYNVLHNRTCTVKHYSLAEPIKEMVMLMLPATNRNILYGPSENRKQIVPGAFKDGQPLTYRALLQDLGTDVCRSYKSDIWLDVLDYNFQHYQNYGYDFFTISDCRFPNEIYHCKKNDFIVIRIKRPSQLILDHPSETLQDTVKDNEFNFIIDNNGTIEDLKEKVINILKTI